MTNLDRSETQALMDAMQPSKGDVQVVPRDFRVPNRLGAERTREGGELAHVRARFLVAARAAGVTPIDIPYTWADAEGCEADARTARRLGYPAKCAVTPDHCAIINRVLTPSPEEAARAARIVEAFESARARGEGRVLLDGSLVELPIYLSAKRLRDRARSFGVA